MTPQKFILNKLRLEITSTIFLVSIFLIGGTLIFLKGADSSDSATTIGGIMILLLGITWALFTFFDYKVHKITSSFNSVEKTRLTEAVLVNHGFTKYPILTNSEIIVPAFYYEKQKVYWKSFPSISSKETKVWIFLTNEGIEFSGYCSGHRGQYPSLLFTKERNKILRKLRECL